MTRRLFVRSLLALSRDHANHGDHPIHVGGLG